MDHSRWEQLVTPVIPRLRRYARALVHDRERADDLVQDALERAWSRIDYWQPGSDMRAWLFTIMHNLHANAARRYHREPHWVGLDQSPEQAGTDGSDSTVLLRDLERGLAALNVEQREVLLLVSMEGLSYEEVAEVTGVALGTVMSRLHRAREHLRAWMAGERVEQLRVVK